MNSDSPSPFFGLQLAVDAETPAVQVPSHTKSSREQPADAADLPAQYLTRARSSVSDRRTPQQQPANAPAFQFTASETAAQGDLKMALPKSCPKSGSPEAEQIANLLHRLKRS